MVSPLYKLPKKVYFIIDLFAIIVYSTILQILVASELKMVPDDVTKLVSKELSTYKIL
jgi:hypothetical protein